MLCRNHWRMFRGFSVHKRMRHRTVRWRMTFRKLLQWVRGVLGQESGGGGGGVSQCRQFIFIALPLRNGRGDYVAIHGSPAPPWRRRVLRAVPITPVTVVERVDR